MNNTASEKNAETQQINRPSWLSQMVPYLFTAGILIYVFAGLSSSVVDEPHTLLEDQWSSLKKSGVRLDSVEMKSLDGKTIYRPGRQNDKTGAGGCTPGIDFEIKNNPEQDLTAIRRCGSSRIPEGGNVLVSYVKKVKISEVWTMVRKADLKVFLPMMALHALIFFFADISSFGFAYRWFSVPDMKLRELMEVRGGPYVIQVGLAPLAEVLFPLYMWRVKKVPAAETVSTNIWTLFIDFSAVMTIITPAIIYNLTVENLIPAIGFRWLAGCMFFWALFVGSILFWRIPAGKRLAAGIASRRQKALSAEAGGLKQGMGSARQLLRTFSLAGRRHILKAYLARLVMLLSTLLSNYVALRALDVAPSLPLAMIGIPLVVLSIFLPIGVGGYGGPQLIAWFLFVKLGQSGTADQVIAYSLLWSTGFLVGRALIGLIFIRGFWKRCFPQGFQI